MTNDTIDVLARQAELGGDPTPDDLPPAAIVQIEAVRPEPPLVGSDRAWTIGKPASRVSRFPKPLLVVLAAVTAVAAAFPFLGDLFQDASRSTATAPAPAGVPAAPPAPIPPAFEVTESVIAGAIDPVTGEPEKPGTSFAPGDDVYLWLSFTSDGSGGALDVTWRRGARKVGFTQTVLPMSSTTMSMTLSGTATERPGQYRAQVRHEGKLVAEETFEVSNG